MRGFDDRKTDDAQPTNNIERHTQQIAQQTQHSADTQSVSYTHLTLPTILLV